MWDSPRPLSTLRSADFEAPGLVFEADGLVFRTLGTRIGQGGMGTAWQLDMRAPGEQRTRPAIAKLYRWEYCLQLRQDQVARRYFAHQQAALARIRNVRHLHLLPTLAVGPIQDNHVFITPFGGEPLVTAVRTHEQPLSPEERVNLLIGALRALRALHEANVVHCDFTLRNILVHRHEDGRKHALLFDFDLSLALDQVPGQTIASFYGGRIVGAPEYSLTPEQLDPGLAAQPMSLRRDIYAIGTALYGLFCDQSVYGPVTDLPSLLEAISTGVVRGGDSKVAYPDEVPEPLREIIDRCLERDPQVRYPDVSTVIRMLERAVKALDPSARGRFRSTLAFVQVERKVKLDEVYAQRADRSLGFEALSEVHAALGRAGYVVERNLGRVKGHPIYAAAPDPQLVAAGKSPDGNAYKKLVTAIDLSVEANPEAYVENWSGRIFPVLQDVRRQLLTALHKVHYDPPSGLLLLFSEYLADTRFGPDLLRHDLQLSEALALSLIIASQIQRLHEQGLAHNNVTLDSLLFKHLPETGQVLPLFVGLVEPRFSTETMADDVRKLAGMLSQLVRRPVANEAPPSHRVALEGFLQRLRHIENDDIPPPPIAALVDSLGEALGHLEPNVAVLRRHGGDVLAYAQLLTRHVLFHYLWGGGGRLRQTGQSGSQPPPDLAPPPPVMRKPTS